MKFFYRKFLTALLLLFFAHGVIASHIMGGYLSYKHISGNTYQIKLTLFRECSSQTVFDGEPSPTQMDATLGIFESSTIFLGPWPLPAPVVTSVAAVYDSSCSNVNSRYCVYKGVYTDTITFPSDTLAYTITYQRCCLSNYVVNVNQPNEAGETFCITIPPTSLFANNSPVFDSFPSVLYYVNQPLTYHVSANDADGDSLVYSLCAPYSGGNATDPAPLPSAPPYTNLTWLAPYALDNIMGGTPPLNIDSASGVMTAMPNTIGSFVVGVCVKEFRNGQLMDTTVINLMFNIDHCIAQATAVANIDSDLDFRLYPNPATDELTITTETNEPVDVSVYDMLGNELRSIQNSSANSIKVKVSDLSAGCYLLKLTSSRGLSSSKGFIIAR